MSYEETKFGFTIGEKVEVISKSVGWPLSKNHRECNHLVVKKFTNYKGYDCVVVGPYSTTYGSSSGHCYLPCDLRKPYNDINEAFDELLYSISI